MNPATPPLVVWLFGITLMVVLALAGMMWIERRETTKRLAEQEKRFTDMATMMASVLKAAEIYERIQERSAEAYARTHDSLLATLEGMTKQTHEMYRDAATRFAQLEERSTNHGQELRRIATNVHDLRGESRIAIASTHEQLRAEIKHVEDMHREDMARLQARRQGDGV